MRRGGTANTLDPVNEGVAIPDRRRDEPPTVSTVTQRLAQGRDVDAKVGLLHSCLGPARPHELPVSHEGPGPLYECDQHVERPPADLDGLLAFVESALLRNQLEAPENERLGVAVPHVVPS